ncbi:MAG: T9SS type A sorting domain-containing protein, partial [Lewinellaceae bacterium]|nr:T9SS type A sorting domain-containing protein [Lewinellaceae bacterium]
GRWLVSIPADVALVASCLDIGPEGKVLVGGSYAQVADFDDEEFSSTGSTGAFVGQLRPALTPTSEAPVQELAVTVFPNPGKGCFYLQPSGVSYAVQVYDSLGRLLKHWVGVDELNLEGLPAGGYLLVVMEGDNRRVLRVQLD